ncbi:MAG: aminoacetone oxidase family FAD-binding enzyme, partial [Bacilli bacterium]|nr:aminoacetone oxidase family FAD-binding enzyme [Bacilli bacterium]
KNAIAKKILVTGNGRCNYWHEPLTISSYYTDNEKNLIKILNHSADVFNQLSLFGIVPKNKDGYLYPLSNQASSIRDMFNYQLTKRNISTICYFKVESITKDGDLFIIKSNTEVIKCDKVIVAVGSNAGSREEDNTIYDILKEFGHTINAPYPSLTPLIVEGAKKYNWSGIRTDAILTLVSDYKIVREERGELQLVNDGISGIVTFNISGYVSRELAKNHEITVRINFLPDIKDVKRFLDERNSILGNVTMNELLNSLINYKLAGLLLHLSHIDGNSLYQSLTDKQLSWLINNINNFECHILDTADYSRAQVCTGGVSLAEINPLTMESIVVPGLYITGEILDVDGLCGGYNLAFAFITGYLAGDGVSCSE